MFEAEARWLARRLARYPAEELSPLLNVGSSTRALRERDQPWTERELFAPLAERGVTLIHLDSREGEGIDIRADILDPADLARIKGAGPKAILCCNILEHVKDRQALARHCTEIVGPGGLIFVTVPYSYPRHRDPIDTLYRPTPAELAALFADCDMAEGTIIDVGESYRGQVKRRPWILLRHLFILPFPFLDFDKWRHSLAKPYWLFHNYKVTGAVFRVRMPAQGPSSGPPR